MCGFQVIAYTYIIAYYYIWTSTKSKATVAKFETTITTTWFDVAVVELTLIEICIYTL